MRGACWTIPPSPAHRNTRPIGARRPRRFHARAPIRWQVHASCPVPRRPRRWMSPR
ncbi:hypothetical protein D187_006033 [Cystobacter fuscus DSM 2262]|uniref:Uncharacterized protein n=1 Tax=Cystobacter fuscus (strain ATCC 25194 / DSM 2262 / NBRC 100088 / M29) TaxID=1242864 RepID=S9PH27_CYSF2|nr:hypothetical protein D187_006033 [Cystobacter fuscus DSM 2262]